MSMPLPLQHIDKYGETNLDTVTLRHLRDAATKANADDAAIRALLSKDLAEKEWDPKFAQDTADRDEAIRRIDAELAKRERAGTGPR